ncbi:MAG: type II toxin-antitoxin system death-on-curing family toxin [Bacteroidetes bacterium]|nr:type II toxin-antitoxin system death-on-curing family toxin [Bacteroidota bacterium]MBS1941259.1 type II toxin-antitoxin system death-on-curing family toxin [Bacteroidota bacterium]
MMHGIITGHPFIDGNKRTGFALARLILQDGGLDIHAGRDEEYDLVIHVATGRMEVEEVHAWMKTRTKPLK